MDVEPLGLEAGEAADGGLELLAHLIEMVQPLAETEVVEVVGAEFIAQKCKNFSYCRRTALKPPSRSHESTHAATIVIHRASFEFQVVRFC